MKTRGTVFAAISLPPASSMERTQAIAKQIDSIGHTIPSVKNTLRLVGFNFIAGSGSAYAMVIMKLKTWDLRKERESLQSVIDQLRKKSRRHPWRRDILLFAANNSGLWNNRGLSIRAFVDKGGYAVL